MLWAASQWRDLTFGSLFFSHLILTTVKESKMTLRQSQQHSLYCVLVCVCMCEARFSNFILTVKTLISLSVWLTFSISQSEASNGQSSRYEKDWWGTFRRKTLKSPQPKLLLASPIVTRGHHISAYFADFTLDALSGKASNAFVSPPGIKPGIFWLLGESVSHYTHYIVITKQWVIISRQSCKAICPFLTWLSDTLLRERQSRAARV